MSRRLAILVLLAGPPQEAAKPGPDTPDVRCGPHARNVFDLRRPRSRGPAPLILYIHGGGFRQEDKKSLPPRRLREYLEAGFAVAAINYRPTDTAPFPAAYLDGARALQTLRHRARKTREP